MTVTITSSPGWMFKRMRGHVQRVRARRSQQDACRAQGLLQHRLAAARIASVAGTVCPKSERVGYVAQFVPSEARFVKRDSVLHGGIYSSFSENKKLLRSIIARSRQLGEPAIPFHVRIRHVNNTAECLIQQGLQDPRSLRNKY
jgi:hypothetical protein